MTSWSKQLTDIGFPDGLAVAGPISEGGNSLVSHLDRDFHVMAGST